MCNKKEKNLFSLFTLQLTSDSYVLHFREEWYVQLLGHISNRSTKFLQ